MVLDGHDTQSNDYSISNSNDTIKDLFFPKNDLNVVNCILKRIMLSSREKENTG